MPANFKKVKQVGGKNSEFAFDVQENGAADEGVLRSVYGISSFIQLSNLPLQNKVCIVFQIFQR